MRLRGLRQVPERGLKLKVPQELTHLIISGLSYNASIERIGALSAREDQELQEQKTPRAQAGKALRALAQAALQP